MLVTVLGFLWMDFEYIRCNDRSWFELMINYKTPTDSDHYLLAGN